MQRFVIGVVGKSVMATVEPYGKVALLGHMGANESYSGDPSIHGDYSMVDAFLPVQVRMISPAEAAQHKTRLSSDLLLAEFKELPEHDDKVLSAWLRMINAKLDAVIGVLERDREEFKYLDHRWVQLSGGGMSFKYAEPAAAGDCAEIKVMLPVAPPMAVYLYGTIVAAGEGRVGVRFNAMDEEIRDRIVHYVFSRQREIFRERRENRRSE